MLCGCHNRACYVAEIALLLAACLGGESCALAMPADEPDISRIQQNAEQGRAKSEIALGDAYLTGHGVHQDLKLAAYWYEKAAGFGDPVAQNQIGYFYQTGMGVQPDAARAAHWYQLSASSGLTSAKVNLGVAYIWGIGVEKNPKTAEKLFEEAANRGDSMALTYLGDMYFFGEGVSQNQAAGERWYQRAVKMHNYLAAFRLGIILSEPSGHPRDMERALGLLRESAATGFVPAMHSAGLLLVNHPDLCASHDEALSLLNASASAGMWKSSVALAALARDGKWVPQDPRMAYFHFRVGALQGGKAAEAYVKNDVRILSAKMSFEELAKIDDEANAWAREHNRPLEILFKGGRDAQSMIAFALAVPQSGDHAGPLIPVAPI
jgi:TPR repeat protein